MNLPDALAFGDMSDSMSVEYVKRKGHFTMINDHFHPQYEMYILLSGERYYFIKDRSYHIRKGDLVFIDKNAIHKTTDVGIPDHERLLIYLNESFLERIYGEHAELLREPFHQFDPVLRVPIADQMLVDNLAAKLLKELHDQRDGFEIVLRHTCVELILLASRYMQKRESAYFQHVAPIHQKITDIVRYINSHYDKPISLPQLSQQFYISAFYLSRTFKEVTGFTFSDYLNLTRIKEAQLLLRETKHPITEIAEKAGFNNFSHFGKIFKKIAHMSPRAYRNQGH
jgi:AraC-like DNA-binding protein